MKGILKSLCLMLYFLTVQIIAGVAVISYKFIFDMSWVDKTYQVMNEFGMISLEYMNCIAELLYPMLIIADISLILPFIIKDKLSMFRKPEAVDVVSILCLAFVCNFTVDSIIALIPASAVTDEYSSMMNMSFLGSPLMVFLCVGILAPIVEELVFRYGIFKALKDKSDNYKIFISALLFGVAHMNLIQGTFAFVLGLVLGKLYAKEKNLTHSLIFHLGVNMSSVLYEYASYDIRAVMLFGVSLSSVFLIFKLSKIYKASLA